MHFEHRQGDDEGDDDYNGQGHDEDDDCDGDDAGVDGEDRDGGKGGEGGDGTANKTTSERQFPNRHHMCSSGCKQHAHGWCIVVPINKILLSKQHLALEQAGKKKKL